MRVDAQRQEMSVGVEREFGMGLMVATLIVGRKTFAARGDPFHRPPQPPRRPGDDGFLGIMLALVAEAAADVGRNQAGSRSAAGSIAR